MLGLRLWEAHLDMFGEWRQPTATWHVWLLCHRLQPHLHSLLACLVRPVAHQYAPPPPRLAATTLSWCSLGPYCAFLLPPPLPHPHSPHGPGPSPSPNTLPNCHLNAGCRCGGDEAGHELMEQPTVQLFSACPDPPNRNRTKWGLLSGQGRGAPEIDIVELV